MKQDTFLLFLELRNPKIRIQYGCVTLRVTLLLAILLRHKDTLLEYTVHVLLGYIDMTAPPPTSLARKCI